MACLIVVCNNYTVLKKIGRREGVENGKNVLNFNSFSIAENTVSYCLNSDNYVVMFHGAFVGVAEP